MSSSRCGTRRERREGRTETQLAALPRPPLRAEYSSLQPPAYTLELTFTINGVTGTPIPCNSSSCLPQVRATAPQCVGVGVLGP